MGPLVLAGRLASAPRFEQCSQPPGAMKKPPRKRCKAEELDCTVSPCFRRKVPGRPLPPPQSPSYPPVFVGAGAGHPLLRAPAAAAHAKGAGRYTPCQPTDFAAAERPPHQKRPWRTYFTTSPPAPPAARAAAACRSDAGTDGARSVLAAARCRWRLSCTAVAPWAATSTSWRCVWPGSRRPRCRRRCSGRRSLGRSRGRGIHGAGAKRSARAPHLGRPRPLCSARLSGALRAAEELEQVVLSDTPARRGRCCSSRRPPHQAIHAARRVPPARPPERHLGRGLPTRLFLRKAQEVVRLHAACAAAAEPPPAAAPGGGRRALRAWARDRTAPCRLPQRAWTASSPRRRTLAPMTMRRTTRGATPGSASTPRPLSTARWRPRHGGLCPLPGCNAATKYDCQAWSAPCGGC